MTLATAAPVRVGRPSKASIRRRRDEGLFWVARQILRADTDAQRAAILLGIPDLVLTAKNDELTEACEFADGAAYIAVRMAAASANRDTAGQLPRVETERLEFWRRGLAAIAGGKAP